MTTVQKRALTPRRERALSLLDVVEVVLEEEGHIRDQPLAAQDNYKLACSGGELILKLKKAGYPGSEREIGFELADLAKSGRASHLLNYLTCDPGSPWNEYEWSLPPDEEWM